MHVKVMMRVNRDSNRKLIYVHLFFAFVCSFLTHRTLDLTVAKNHALNSRRSTPLRIYANKYFIKSIQLDIQFDQKEQNTSLGVVVGS